MGERKDPAPFTPKGGDRSDLAAYGRFAGVGLQFGFSIILFLYLGKWADAKLGTAPWLLILGVFTGAGAAFYSIYRSAMADLKREEDQHPPHLPKNHPPGNPTP